MILLYFVCFISLSNAFTLKYQNVKIGQDAVLNFELGPDIVKCNQYSTQCFNPGFMSVPTRNPNNMMELIFQRDWECVHEILDTTDYRNFTSPYRKECLIEKRVTTRFPGKYIYSNETDELIIKNVEFKNGFSYKCSDTLETGIVKLNIIHPDIKCADIMGNIVCVVEYSSDREIRLVKQNVSSGNPAQCKQDATGFICFHNNRALTLRRDPIYAAKINRMRESNCTSVAIFEFQFSDFNRDGMMEFSFPEMTDFVALRIKV